jgi:hypothetical protein
MKVSVKGRSPSSRAKKKICELTVPANSELERTARNDPEHMSPLEMEWCLRPRHLRGPAQFQCFSTAWGAR